MPTFKLRSKDIGKETDQRGVFNTDLHVFLKDEII